MKTIPRTWNIDTVKRRQGRINPKPQYQRTAVWNTAKKQLLLDSILRTYDVPKFYLRESPNPPYEHEVVDGQQRLRAIWDYLADLYELGDASKSLPQGDLSGREYSVLPSDVKDDLGLYELSIVIIEDADDLEIRDLFLRLQEGVTLNPAEKRNAMPGKMRDFVEELGETHPVFGLTQIPPKRFAYHDLVALAVCLEIEGGPTDIKAPSLRKMYEDEQGFNSNSSVGKKVTRVLGYLVRVLRSQPPEMDIKWGFVDLYLLVSELDRDYVLKGRERDICSFFVSFEKERTLVDDSADLLDAKDPWQTDLYEYIQAFQTSGGNKKNVQMRHEVYLRRVLRDIPDLEPKDPKRLFTTSERIVIWRRDNCECRLCNKKLKFDEAVADHVTPHSKGGKTIIENGQCLCVPCNSKKGAN